MSASELKAEVWRQNVTDIADGSRRPVKCERARQSRLPLLTGLRGYMKKRDYIILGLVIVLAIILRVLFIDKPAGFWHNEMVMYNQTIAGGPLDIIKAAVDADVHFPLYQLMLALWIKIFGNGDITIRLFSVLAGVLNVVAAFFTGKEIKNEKTGNIFAFLTAINATLIFYSQEVKFYIFLSMFATVSLYFIARILKHNKNTDYAGYIITNAAIVYTFTIGVLYVIAQGIATLAYILWKNKQTLKKFLLANLILIGVISPFAIYILTHMHKYEAAAWIFTSNIFTTFVLIQNYFTPYLIGIYNNPQVYIPTLGFTQILFIYIPVGIAFYGIYKGVRIDKKHYLLLVLPLLFLIFETILCMNSGLRMLTRYTILAIPPLLLLVSIGLSELKSITIKIIITYMLIINVFYLLASPISAVRGYRDLGEKPTANVLNSNNIKDNDTIILALRKNDFDKYINFNGRKFSLLQDFVHEPYAMNSSKQDKYEKYKDYVLSINSLSPEFEKDFLSRVIEPMNTGDRIFYIWDENYNAYPLKSLEEYKKLPVMTGSLSKMNADAFILCQKYLKIKSGVKLKYYRVFIFEK